MPTTRALIFTLAYWCVAASLAQPDLAPPAATDRLDPPVYTKLLPPPGPIEETMKTLDQVEPRTPANDLGGDMDWAIIIDQPGSYYLTENVVPPFGKNGIDIRVSSVTLDLNGFRVDGRNTGEHQFSVGIEMDQNTVVRNGIVMNWNGRGVCASFGNVNNTVSDVRVLNITDDRGEALGISVSVGSAVRDCRVREIEGSGIGIGGGSIAEGCTVSGCDEIGITASAVNTGTATFPASIYNCTVSGCRTGIRVDFGAQIIECLSGWNREYGYYTWRGALLKDCVSSFDPVGFRIEAGSIATDCLASASHTAGFLSGSGASLTNCGVWNSQGNAFMPIPNGLPYDAKYKDCIASTCFGYGFLLIKPNGVIEGCDAVDNFFGITIEPGATDSIVQSCNLYGNDAGLDCQADDTVIEHNKLRGPSPLTVSGVNNLIIRNSIEGGAANASIVPGNRDAAIVDHPDLAGPWSNLSY